MVVDKLVPPSYKRTSSFLRVCDFADLPIFVLFQQITLKLGNCCTTFQAPFQRCRRILTNWSMSKFKKKRGVSIEHFEHWMLFLYLLYFVN